MSIAFQSPQELFDECVGHVLKQGRAAVVESFDDSGAVVTSSCVYLSPDGLSCAMGGPIVKRGLYEPWMEMKTIEHEALSKVRWALGITDGTMLALARKLQSAHDEAQSEGERFGCNFLDSFRVKAENVAARFGLSAAILSETEGEKV